MKKISSQAYLLAFIIFFRFNRDAFETFILSLLPVLAVYFQTAPKSVALAIPIFFTGTFLAKFLFSYCCHRFSVRYALLIQLSLVCLGSLLSLIPSLKFFLLSRLIQGLGIGCTTSATSVLVKNELAGDSFAKIWAFTGMIIVWAPVISNAISGYLYYLGYWYWILPLFFSFSLILLLAAYFLLSEAQNHQEKPAESNWLDLSFFRQAYFRHYLIIYVLLFSVIPVFYTISPFLFIKTLHVPIHYFWLVTFVILFGNFIGKTAVNLWLHTLSAFKVTQYLIILANLSSCLLMFFALIKIHSATLILVPCFFITVSYSISGPILKDEMFKCFTKTQRPAVASTLGLMVSTASILFSFIATFLKHESIFGLASLYLFFSLAATFSFLMLKILSYTKSQI